jgi:hypothetical protein
VNESHSSVGLYPILDLIRVMSDVASLGTWAN